MTRDETLKAIGRFVLNTIVGSLLFLTIILVAILLNWFGDWVNAQHVHWYVGKGVDGLEFLLFALDAVLFIVFEVKEAYILGKSIVYGP